ncbi:MAG: SCP2 sterol-binding domain-containing protein [Gammaproteobacteria bacterium]|nr:SCP2 sterol-binding domain-containing protein [Gammaproteobacteria bacterium]
MTSADRAAGPEAVLADMLAELANRSLDLDPASRARLAALEGSRIQLTAQFPGFGPRDFTLSVQAGRLRLFPHALEAPQIIVRGSAADLAAAIFGASDSARSRLEIDGDHNVLQELTAAVHGYRPDLDGPLSRMLGPQAATSVLGTAEMALAGLRSALEGAGSSMRQSASRAFVDRAEANRLIDDLDDLRQRIDRLGARVAAREQRKAEP